MDSVKEQLEEYRRKNRERQMRDASTSKPKEQQLFESPTTAVSQEPPPSSILLLLLQLRNCILAPFAWLACLLCSFYRQLPFAPVLTRHWCEKRWLRISVKLAAWLLAFWWSVRVEFGSVFVIFSLFVLLLMSLDDRRRAPGEMSAYSVFNPNLERLAGTFTAEQFEEHLRFGTSKR